MSNRLMQGLSLRHAYTPSSSQERSDFLAAHPCAACGKQGMYVDGDPGKERRTGAVRFLAVAMKCVCGFANLVYVINNDLKSGVSAREALAELDRRGLLDDSELTRQLVDTGVLLFLGNRGEALEVAKRCANEFPGSAAAHYNCGVLLYEKGESTQSLRYLDRTLAIDPAFTAALFYKGLAHRAIGNVEAALESAERFLRFHPSHLQAKELARSCRQGYSN